MAVAVTADGSDIHANSAVSIAISTGDCLELAMDCRKLLPSGIRALQQVFSAPTVKVFADAASELPFLAGLGIAVAGPIFDVTLASRLLHIAAMREDPAPGPQGVDRQKQDLESGAIGNPASQSASAGGKTAGLLRMRERLIPDIVRLGMTQVTDIELRCIPAVAHMYRKGIHLDRAMWERLAETVREERSTALAALAPWLGGPVTRPSLWGGEVPFGHNLDSNAFVLKLLHRHGVKARSTARRDLAPHHDHPLVRALGAYRKASKALSAFLLPFPGMIHPATGRLHPQYEQLTAFSGRMSCHHPNIQQIPRERAFRECFTAPPGRCLIVADYSQIELRVAAQLARDARMLAAYQAGDDLHLLTASHLSGKPMELVSRQERQAYKAVNLGLIYGMGAEGLRETARQSYGVDMPLEQATLFRRRFFETYRGIHEWHQRIKGDAAREGRTLTGRRFPFSPEAGLPERSNLPVQGTAADIIKKALGMLVNRLDQETWIVAVVHDEILLECPAAGAKEAAALLRSTMEEAANAILPDVPTMVEAVISASWAEK